MPVSCVPAPGIDASCGLEQRLHENNIGILADTLDFETLSLHKFSGSLLTPGRVYEALKKKQLGYYITAATKKGLERLCDADETRTRRGRREIVASVIDQFFLELATAIGDRVPGPHVVLVDPRKHDNLESMVAIAQRMHRTFRTQGVPQDSIIVSIPATEAGIRAAQALQTQGILTNLYLVTSLMHAAACAEAKTAAISISIGPLLAKYEDKHKVVYNDLTKHPGIECVRSILKYFELNGIRTKVLGTAFRSLAEVGQLSECDAVCVSDKQANRLKWSTVPTAALHGEEDRRIELRARQAKYPTDLLTREGGFATWFSRDSRNLTNDLLRGALREMQGQMNTIQRYVEAEIDKQASYRGPPIWMVGYREDAALEWKAFRGELSHARVTVPDSDEAKQIAAPSQVEFPVKSDTAEANQAMDEVF